MIMTRLLSFALALLLATPALAHPVTIYAVANCAGGFGPHAQDQCMVIIYGHADPTREECLRAVRDLGRDYRCLSVEVEVPDWRTER